MTRTGAVILLVGLSTFACHSFFVWWRVYLAYQLLGDRGKQLGFRRFLVQFILLGVWKGASAHTVAARYAADADYFDALPVELKDPIVALRREIFIAYAVFFLGLISLICGGLIYRDAVAQGYI